MSPTRRWPQLLLSLIASGAWLAMAAPLSPWFLARSTSSEAWTGLLLLLVGVGLAATVDGGDASSSGSSSSSSSSRLTSVALALVGGLAVIGGVLVDVRLLQAMGLATTAAALVPV